MKNTPWSKVNRYSSNRFRWGKYTYLEDIFVRSEFRKNGIGRKLFTSVIQKSRDEHGSKSMIWAVLDWNVDAKKFYGHFGGEELEGSVRFRFADKHNFLVDSEASENWSVIKEYKLFKGTGQ